MRNNIGVIATILLSAGLLGGAAPAAPPPPPQCDVPQELIASDANLFRVLNESKAQHRLDISVIGTGSSALAGPDGLRFAYPARLQDALK